MGGARAHLGEEHPYKIRRGVERPKMRQAWAVLRKMSMRAMQWQIALALDHVLDRSGHEGGRRQAHQTAESSCGSGSAARPRAPQFGLGRSGSSTGVASPQRFGPTGRAGTHVSSPCLYFSSFLVGWLRCLPATLSWVADLGRYAPAFLEVPLSRVFAFP